MMRVKRVHRELAALMKNLHSQFEDQVELRESTFEIDDDDGPVVRFTICPNDGKISMAHSLIAQLIAYIIIPNGCKWTTQIVISSCALVQTSIYIPEKTTPYSY